MTSRNKPLSNKSTSNAHKDELCPNRLNTGQSSNDKIPPIKIIKQKLSIDTGVDPDDNANNWQLMALESLSFLFDSRSKGRSITFEADSPQRPTPPIESQSDADPFIFNLLLCDRSLVGADDGRMVDVVPNKINQKKFSVIDRCNDIIKSSRLLTNSLITYSNDQVHSGIVKQENINNQLVNGIVMEETVEETDQNNDSQLSQIGMPPFSLNVKNENLDLDECIERKDIDIKVLSGNLIQETFEEPDQNNDSQISQTGMPPFSLNVKNENLDLDECIEQEDIDIKVLSGNFIQETFEEPDQNNDSQISQTGMPPFSLNVKNENLDLDECIEQEDIDIKVLSGNFIQETFEEPDQNNDSQISQTGMPPFSLNVKNENLDLDECIEQEDIDIKVLSGIFIQETVAETDHNNDSQLSQTGMPPFSLYVKNENLDLDECIERKDIDIKVLSGNFIQETFEEPDQNNDSQISQTGMPPFSLNVKNENLDLDECIEQEVMDNKWLIIGLIIQETVEETDQNNDSQLSQIGMPPFSLNVKNENLDLDECIELEDIDIYVLSGISVQETVEETDQNNDSQISQIGMPPFSLNVENENLDLDECIQQEVMGNKWLIIGLIIQETVEEPDQNNDSQISQTVMPPFSLNVKNENLDLDECVEQEDIDIKVLSGIFIQETVAEPDQNNDSQISQTGMPPFSLYVKNDNLDLDECIEQKAIDIKVLSGNFIQETFEEPDQNNDSQISQTGMPPFSLNVKNENLDLDECIERKDIDIKVLSENFIQETFEEPDQNNDSQISQTGMPPFSLNVKNENLDLDECIERKDIDIKVLSGNFIQETFEEPDQNNDSQISQTGMPPFSLNVKNENLDLDECIEQEDIDIKVLSGNFIQETFEEPDQNNDSQISQTGMPPFSLNVKNENLDLDECIERKDIDIKVLSGNFIQETFEEPDQNNDSQISQTGMPPFSLNVKNENLDLDECIERKDIDIKVLSGNFIQETFEEPDQNNDSQISQTGMPPFSLNVENENLDLDECIQQEVMGNKWLIIGLIIQETVEEPDQNNDSQISQTVMPPFSLNVKNENLDLDECVEQEDIDIKVLSGIFIQETVAEPDQNNDSQISQTGMPPFSLNVKNENLDLDECIEQEDIDIKVLSGIFIQETVAETDHNNDSQISQTGMPPFSLNVKNENLDLDECIERKDIDIKVLSGNFIQETFEEPDQNNDSQISQTGMPPFSLNVKNENLDLDECIERKDIDIKVLSGNFIQETFEEPDQNNDSQISQTGMPPFSLNVKNENLDLDECIEQEDIDIKVLSGNFIQETFEEPDQNNDSQISQTGMPPFSLNVKNENLDLDECIEQEDIDIKVLSGIFIQETVAETDHNNDSQISQTGMPPFSLNVKNENLDLDECIEQEVMDNKWLIIGLIIQETVEETDQNNDSQLSQIGMPPFSLNVKNENLDLDECVEQEDIDFKVLSGIFIQETVAEPDQNNDSQISQTGTETEEKLDTIDTEIKTEIDCINNYECKETVLNESISSKVIALKNSDWMSNCKWESPLTENCNKMSTASNLTLRTSTHIGDNFYKCDICEEEIKKRWANGCPFAVQVGYK
ncbi:hypothetical protein QTP88_016780 [Uroleucon formosanum]